MGSKPGGPQSKHLRPIKDKDDPRRKKNPRLGTGIPFDLKVAMKALGPEAAATIKAVMKGKGSPAARVRAAEIAMERGYGKVPQDINANLSGSITVNVSVKLVEPKGTNGSDNA